MKGLINTNIELLETFESDFRSLVKVSDCIYSELNQESTNLRNRIQRCLDEATEKRVQCEIELNEAIRKKEEIASAGGDTALALVSYAASTVMDAEIALREAELIKAQKRENDIRNVLDDYNVQINPIISTASGHLEMLRDSGCKSERYLSALVMALRNAQAEASSVIHGGALNRFPSNLETTAIERHHVVTDLTDKVNEPRNEVNSHQSVLDEKTGVESSESSMLSQYSCREKKEEGEFPEAQPMYGSFEKKERTLGNGEKITTSGLSDDIVERLISNQGNNIFGYKNCCTLSTISNINTILGRDQSESKVVAEAVARGLCETGRSPVEFNGGMDDKGIQTILGEVYGVETVVKPAKQLTPEEIGEYIEGGHIVTVGVDSGSFWGGVPVGYANHQVLITKVIRNNDTGFVEGFFVADTGANRSDGNNVFVSIDTMNRSFFGEKRLFGNVGNATAIISKKKLIM